MSTLPGPETWRDAGLDQVDPGGDVEIASDSVAPVAARDPDVSVEANPADVVEQVQAVVPDENGGANLLPDADLLAEANPADLVEQAQSVPPDERDEYP